MPSDQQLNDYYKKKYYKTLKGNRSMTDRVSDPDGFYAIQYVDRLRHIRRFLKKGQPRTLIDIGAGYGDFLAFMKKNGWSVQGAEPSLEACRTIKDRSLNVKPYGVDNLLEAGFKPASVVTLNNVLEHLRNPLAVLETVKKYLLAKGGIISIIVPNDFNVLQEVLKKAVLKNNASKKHYWVAPPDHLNYWSTKSIVPFLERAGFKVLFLITDFPLELFPLMGDDYVLNPEIGRSVHLKRVKLEKHFRDNDLLPLKDGLYKSFADLGMGRDMQVIAVPIIKQKK
jgi:SAM-dependent methyltransferase